MMIDGWEKTSSGHMFDHSKGRTVLLGRDDFEIYDGYREQAGQVIYFTDGTATAVTGYNVHIGEITGWDSGTDFWIHTGPITP